MAGLGAYAVAKEGIRALTKVAMLEWGADNIRVNTDLSVGARPTTGTA